MRTFARTLAAALLIAASGHAAATEVMILGTYHMANPGHDLHNLKADDVLAGKRQRELESVAAGLAKFKPTVVAVEADTDNGAPAKLAKYHDYVAGKLAESRNEVVQIGFRLARRMQLADVFGIDVDGDFPFDAVKAFADNGHPELTKTLDQLGADFDRMLQRLGETLESGTVGAGLRWLNDPKQIAQGQAFYAAMLRFGAGDRQPGVELLSAWQHRNDAICARIVQLAKPEDRVVVVYGSGHAYLLRQCVREMPGYTLVEPNDFLPR